jgi:Ni/Co efflux regulator RcnB
MKRLLLAISLAFLSTTPALADDHGRDRGHDRAHGHGHDKHHGDSRGKQGKRHRQYDMHRGEHIPVVYLEREYYVQDYRVYHLAPPPRGHRWVRTDDGKYILIAVATGIIADIILNH